MNMMESALVFLEIVMINLLLSGDNAIVIAMAGRRLPPEQRRRAVWWGAAAAIFLRCVLTLGAIALLNVPFSLSLFFSRHVPATEYALVVSTAPFWNYILALVRRRESAHPRRIGALMLGFLSSAVLILTRDHGAEGIISWWLAAAFIVPIIYSAYNSFAAEYWPKKADTLTVGALESVFSGLLAIPFMLVLAPPWSAATPPLFAYWTALAASALWIVERIAFFTLIRDKGALYTIQAIYVSTPAAVLWAIMIFGRPADAWIWLSLAILMGALWLNNSTQRVAM